MTPIDFQEWINAQDYGEEKFVRGAFGAQCMVLRDSLRSLIAFDLSYEEATADRKSHLNAHVEIDTAAGGRVQSA